MTGFMSRLVLAATASLELSIVVKATMLLGVVLAGMRLAPRARAAARHTILAAAFGALLALPVAAVSFPALTIHVPVSPVGRPAPVAREPQPTDSRSAMDVTDRSIALTVVQVIWIVGALMLAAPYWWRLWHLARMRRGGRAWAREHEVFGRLRTRGSRPPADLVISDEVVVPMTFGVRRPVILLPPSVDEWTEEDVDRALLHELEHVRRRDWMVALVARAVCAIYWFHPLVWIGWRRLSLEAERACDDAVLVSADQAAYADQLVALARRLADRPPHTALAMASRTDLSVRIRAVLDDRQRRGRTSGWNATAIAATMALVVATVGPLTAAARDTSRAGPSSVTPQSANAEPSGRAPAFNGADIKPSDQADEHAKNSVSAVRAVKHAVAFAKLNESTLVASTSASTLATASQSSQAPAVMMGTVKDSTGTPLSGVIVEIHEISSGRDPLIATTDAAGAFAAVDLQPGTYTVVFRLPEYVTYKREGLMVPEGKTAIVNAILKEGLYN